MKTGLKRTSDTKLYKVNNFFYGQGTSNYLEGDQDTSVLKHWNSRSGCFKNRLFEHFKIFKSNQIIRKQPALLLSCSCSAKLSLFNWEQTASVYCLCIYMFLVFAATLLKSPLSLITHSGVTNNRTFSGHWWDIRWPKQFTLLKNDQRSIQQKEFSPKRSIGMTLD